MTVLAVVSCADSGEVHALGLDPRSGRLQPRQVLALGGMLMPMARHPALPRLYVARRSAPMAVVTLSVAPDGGLQVEGEGALPASMAYLSCDRSGRWLLSASYGEDCVSVGAIAPDGLAAPTAVRVPTGRHAHSIVPDAANRFVYAAALGSDAIHCFVLDASKGALHPTEPAVFAMPAGSGPRHLVFNADGSRLYAVGELDGGVYVLACEPATGALTLLQRCSCLQEGTDGAPWAAELRLSPDGRLLLATERRSSTLTLFAVDRQDGRLHTLARHAVEAQPRGAQWSPDGRHVLVAGQSSHHLAAFAVDAASGGLELCDRVPVGANPNWVETLDLPAAST